MTVARLRGTPTDVGAPTLKGPIGRSDCGFARFVRGAAICPFDRTAIRLPARHRFYNDDVHLEAYRPAAFTY